MSFCTIHYLPVYIDGYNLYNQSVMCFGYKMSLFSTNIKLHIVKNCAFKHDCLSSIKVHTEIKEIMFFYHHTVCSERLKKMLFVYFLFSLYLYFILSSVDVIQNIYTYTRRVIQYFFFYF